MRELVGDTGARAYGKPPDDRERGPVLPTPQKPSPTPLNKTERMQRRGQEIRACSLYTPCPRGGRRWGNPTDLWYKRAVMPPPETLPVEPLPESLSAEHWMEEALRLAAEAAARDEVPVGALLVQGDLVLGRGRNRREETHRTASHAELEALDEFNARYRTWRLPPGTRLIVTAEPCLMCTGALLWARLDAVQYGCPDPRRAGLETQRTLIESGVFDHRFREMRGGILADRAAELMKAFFRRKRSALKA